MPDPLLQRIPMVGGLGYIDRVRRLPSILTVELLPERDHRYFLYPIAVMAQGQRVGYVAPEIARRYHALLLAQLNPVTCPARRASLYDHQSSGVELILDFSSLPIEPAP